MGVFVVALTARIAVVVAQLELGLFDISFEAADTALYRALADSLVAEGAFAVGGEPTAFVTPGYPLFLALLFTGGRSTLFIALVQSGLGALTAVLVGAVAGRLAGRRAAWVAGLIAAVYPHLLFWTGYVLTETLYVFLVAFALWLVAVVVVAGPEDGAADGGGSSASHRGARPDGNHVRSGNAVFARWGVAALAGAAFGAAALTRPLILGFALLLVAAGVVARRTRVVAVSLLVGLMLVMAPWVVRNAVTFGSPVVTSTESGYVLWQGNSPGTTGGTRGYVDGADFDPLEFPPGTSEVERDRIYRSRALAWMTDNPDRVISLVPNKLWNMWRPTYAGSSLLNRLVTYATYLPLLIAATVGLYLLGRIRGRGGLLGWVIIGFVGYHLVVHGLVTGMIRFRVPVEAILIVPAGVALVWAYDRVVGRREQGADREPVPVGGPT